MNEDHGSELDKVKKRYDRFSPFYDISESVIEKGLFGKWRSRTISGLEGKILEVGVGTGKNLRYYSNKVNLTAIDISPGMLRKARKKAEKLKLKADLRLMDAQNLEFEDETFDYVISTFVLCSVPDPVKALREMTRVLKSEGKIITLDHVLSKNRIIAMWENVHNPVTVRLFGFNVNRDTKGNMKKAGLEVYDENVAFFDVFRRFTCTKGNT
jgi:demethylmenaquinone methyltransferase/2-methoxy-6-polyprenyl-1,4-benzoquinol methylase